GIPRRLGRTDLRREQRRLFRFRCRAYSAGGQAGFLEHVCLTLNRPHIPSSPDVFGRSMDAPDEPAHDEGWDEYNKTNRSIVVPSALGPLHLLAEHLFDRRLREFFRSAADADGTCNLAVDHDRHTAGAREVADPDRRDVTLCLDV